MKVKWLKKEDQVVVLTGNDKGKIGKIMACGEEKVIVQGINIRKKHLKKTSQTKASQIINIERPINISNVALCDKDGNKLKLRAKTNEKGGKELYYLKDGKEVIYRSLNKKGK